MTCRDSSDHSVYPTGQRCEGYMFPLGVAQRPPKNKAKYRRQQTQTPTVL